MGLINQSGIIDGQVVYAEHVLRIINALSAISNNDILITGNFQNTGSFTVYGTASFYGDSIQISSSLFLHTSSITNDDTYSRVLVQDPGTGKIFFRNSNTLSGSSGTVTGSVWSIGGNSFTSSVDQIFGILTRNNLLFYVSGSEIARFTTGSVFGINNSSPTALVHIKGRGTTTSASFQVDDNTSNPLFKILDNGRVGIGVTNPGYNLEVLGSFAATTKSFLIKHPTKSNYKLRYGSLEGPENGVYIRGRSQSHIISLPDYWSGLIDENSITVNLTPIGKHQKLFVKEINKTSVIIDNNTWFSKLDYFYTIYAERIDVDKLVVEIKE
jgi:hypothetical protein